MIPARDRRAHPRSWFLLGHAHLAARMRTGSPLRVLNTSPDGMLVESPARLLPGRHVELVLQSGTTREQAPWLIVHSRVGCLRGRSEIRYRAGLRRSTGTDYPPSDRPGSCRNALPTQLAGEQPARAFGAKQGEPRTAGTEFGSVNQP
jgi:hypothetical protein